MPFPEEPFDFGWHHHAGFTDPFRLFESIFGELHNAMFDPFVPRRRDRHHDVHHQRGRGFFDDHHGMGFPFDRGFDDTMNPSGRTRVYSQVSRSTVTPDGRIVSESRMTRTVNGVTESIWKRRDRSVCSLTFTSVCLNRSRLYYAGQRVCYIHLSRRTRTAHSQRA